MTTADAEIVAHACVMRANYIETGDVILGRQDLRPTVLAHQRCYDKVARLSDSQQVLIARLHALAAHIRSTNQLP